MGQQHFCQWQYNPVRGRLAILLPSKNLVFTTLTEKHLASDGFVNSPCSLVDFDDYNRFTQLLLACGFEQETLEILAYSAVATQHFLLPSQPKSWFFQPCGSENIEPQILAQVKIKQTGQWAMVLVTNIEGSVANCLWLENDLALTGLQLTFGEPFRIFVDRLQAVNLNITHQYYQQSA
ncbi:cell division protein ZapC domain-containing protein [Volucribacter amazonae]|uniref:Cell-division protein ZapC C-terminal domain-containing protein n=1 Tax=Volucribacter amazonae TaxID=256731 RepID=A0A9X4PAS2_9PAST|nr:cell division protein ZapC domain-containing protein [Volucribacter amazonae]MDG6894121.1 hypothetical protein [Volucribacter amazonae]